MGHRKSTAQRFQLLGTIVLALAVLAGCGQDGSQGPAGAAGSAPVTSATGLTADQQQALSMTGTVTSVTIPSDGRPVVNFTLKDSSGKGISGLGYTSQSSTATVASLTNIQFAFAKLVPADATTGAPSKWVSYIVTTVPTTTTPTVKPSRPGTDAQGTLVDHGDGSYTYTFYRSIAQAQSVLNSYNTATYPSGGAPATDDITDLGDVSYVSSAIHRLVIQVGGNVRGTGTNTANAVQVTPGVPMSNPIDIIYDFIPSTGQTVTASATTDVREIVKVSSCFECHTKFTFHGGNSLKNWAGARQDTRYCVVCHTDQRKYGYAEATVDNTVTPPNYTTSINKLNGLAGGNLPRFVHMIHMGDELYKTGYQFPNLTSSDRVIFNEITYPQDRRNCVKCHDGTAGAANQTAQGDNWKNKPSRLACVACHDNVDYATGAITPLAGGAAAPHNGGDWGAVTAPDTTCATCHTPTDIATTHIPVAPPNPLNYLVNTSYSAYTNAAWVAGYTNNLPAGAIKITYVIKPSGITVDPTTRRPSIAFKLRQDTGSGPQDVVFNDSTLKPEMIDNFVGAPSVYFTFAVPQDGNNTPADFNASVSGYLKTIWNGTATGSGAGTISATPDTSGYYTVTLTGVTIPTNATMLTGGVGFTYALNGTQPLTQITDSAGAALAGYPSPDPAQSNATYPAGVPGTGGLIVQTPVQFQVAVGYTGRRNIVETARCTKCHAQLGVQPAFHAGERNDAQTCNWCHRANQTSSGWSARSNNFVHGIHSAAKRTTPFTWHAVSPTGFDTVTFPGVLRNCQACHLPGMYDFSNSVYSDALIGNLLFTTVAAGTLSTPSVSLSPYIAADLAAKGVTSYNYGAAFSYNAATSATTAAATTTKVNSPIATACFACHDSNTAQAHMRQNGAVIYADRSTILNASGVAVNNEQCLVCHGPGKLAAIADMHAKQ